MLSGAEMENEQIQTVISCKHGTLSTQEQILPRRVAAALLLLWRAASRCIKTFQHIFPAVPKAVKQAGNPPRAAFLQRSYVCLVLTYPEGERATGGASHQHG